MADYISIYSTFGSAEKAQEVAKKLVEEGLVACVNISAPITSIYKWKGKVEESAEVAFLAKTRKSLFGKVKGLIVEMHDYEIPCIVAYDIAAGDEKFLGWIEKETKTIA